MSSTQSTSSAQERLNDDHKAEWYPWGNAHGPLHVLNNQPLTSEYFHNLLREQELKYESKHLETKNELISLRAEVLKLRETVFSLRSEMSKIRPIIDERKRNSLIRKREPFPFTAEHTKQNDATTNTV